MKTFTQFVTELKTASTFSDQPLDEATVHLAPHGSAGTHFKVVKGLPGQLEKGEVIHDSHIDDLHDVGIKTKILANEDMNDEERLVFEAADVTDLDDLFEEDEQIDEASSEFKIGDRILRREDRLQGTVKSIHPQSNGRNKIGVEHAPSSLEHYWEHALMHHKSNGLVKEDEQLDEQSNKEYNNNKRRMKRSADKAWKEKNDSAKPSEKVKPIAGG